MLSVTCGLATARVGYTNTIDRTVGMPDFARLQFLPAVLAHIEVVGRSRYQRAARGRLPSS